jgi:uncharacterized protein GlcG (DUF336 family)
MTGFTCVMARALALTALVVLVSGSPGSPQSLPTEKALPASLAAEAANAAIDSCQKQGYRVSVAVVDRAGVTRVLVRGDGAGPHTLDTSTRKAYTAATFKAPTTRVMENVNSNPAAAGLRNVDRVLLVGGGLPIQAGNEVIGAIGVGGAPGGNLDEACAQARIDRIKDRLN